MREQGDKGGVDAEVMGKGRERNGGINVGLCVRGRGMGINGKKEG